MTDEMTVEKAREIIERFKHLEKPMQDPLIQTELKLAIYQFKEARGFLAGWDARGLKEALTECSHGAACFTNHEKKDVK